MRRVAIAVAFLWSVLMALPSLAQDAWVQIEALPTLTEGEARARAYGGVFPDVNGFELTSGWYGIVLGPYSPEEAEERLALLRAEGLIPRDSYIPDSTRFVRRFWPAGAAPLAAPADPAADPLIAAPEPLEPAETVVVPELPAELPDETPREARASESALSAEERQALQTALQWEGFYAGKIDGAIGAGTRNSMAAWQASRGYEETGILTTRQRAQLIEEYSADVASIGLATVAETKAGIEIAIPEKLVSFRGYQPPFVHYDEKDGSGFQVALISQQGDEAALSGLYDIMQTLEIVPVDGERKLQRTSFTIAGRSPTLESYTQAELSGGLIKGFTLAWKPEDSQRAQKVLDAMKASFRPVGEEALDDSLGEPLGEDKDALLAGIEVRRPILSRSGFYVDATGSVVTSADAVQGCGRITIDLSTDADVRLTDPALGLAVLTPKAPLSPLAVAAFRTTPARVGSEIAVAGYPYEDTLTAPVVTFGTLAANEGLAGEAGQARLSVSLRPGDAGGPVLDSSGSVAGLVLPPSKDATRILPDDVALALPAGPLVEALTLAGLTITPSDRGGAIAAEDVARAGREITALVSCWE